MPEPIAMLNAVPAPVGWTAAAMAALWLAGIFLRRGQDTFNSYKAGSVFADGMDSLKERVDLMDAKITRLERDRSKLISFCSKVIAHFGGCGHCKMRQDGRESLQQEFDRIMVEITKDG